VLYPSMIAELSWLGPVLCKKNVSPPPLCVILFVLTVSLFLCSALQWISRPVKVLIPQTSPRVNPTFFTVSAHTDTLLLSSSCI
jgi:hypothetical protein